MRTENPKIGLVRVAGIALAMAWGVRALSGAKPSSFILDLMFYTAALVVVCVMVLDLLGLVERWMRPEDAAWLQRQTRRWAMPSVAAAGLAVLLCLDQGWSVWVRAPEMSEILVVRTVCSHISSGAARVSIQSNAAEGQWCFHATKAKSRQGKLWRVNIEQVKPAREIGKTGRLQLRLYPSWIFGAGAYTVVQGVL